MNLWLRLLWLVATARRRGRLALPADASVIAFRVWPHDLDPSIHMNNGRYLTLMDLGRTDIMLRSGLWREVWRNRWTPIASAITIRFRRELRTFQKFRLETRLVSWDATLVVMEQTFLIDGGTRDGQIAAQALFKGGLYDRKARSFVPIARLMQSIGVSAVSPRPTPEVAAFLKADAELKQAGRG
jgi:acyl-CoA thioesterase FadM